MSTINIIAITECNAGTGDLGYPENILKHYKESYGKNIDDIKYHLIAITPFIGVARTDCDKVIESKLESKGGIFNTVNAIRLPNIGQVDNELRSRDLKLNCWPTTSGKYTVDELSCLNKFNEIFQENNQQIYVIMGNKGITIGRLYNAAIHHIKPVEEESDDEMVFADYDTSSEESSSDSNSDSSSSDSDSDSSSSDSDNEGVRSQVGGKLSNWAEAIRKALANKVLLNFLINFFGPQSCKLKNKMFIDILCCNYPSAARQWYPEHIKGRRFFKQLYNKGERWHPNDEKDLVHNFHQLDNTCFEFITTGEKEPGKFNEIKGCSTSEPIDLLPYVLFNQITESKETNTEPPPKADRYLLGYISQAKPITTQYFQKILEFSHKLSLDSVLLIIRNERQNAEKVLKELCDSTQSEKKDKFNADFIGIYKSQLDIYVSNYQESTVWNDLIKKSTVMVVTGANSYLEAIINNKLVVALTKPWENELPYLFACEFATILNEPSFSNISPKIKQSLLYIYTCLYSGIFKECPKSSNIGTKGANSCIKYCSHDGFHLSPDETTTLLKVHKKVCYKFKKKHATGKTLKAINKMVVVALQKIKGKNNSSSAGGESKQRAGRRKTRKRKQIIKTHKKRTRRKVAPRRRYTNIRRKKN